MPIKRSLNNKTCATHRTISPAREKKAEIKGEGGLGSREIERGITDWDVVLVASAVPCVRVGIFQQVAVLSASASASA